MQCPIYNKVRVQCTQYYFRSINERNLDTPPLLWARLCGPTWCTLGTVEVAGVVGERRAAAWEFGEKG